MALNKILTANRAEIAVRIIRVFRKLGIKTAAVFSDPADNFMPFQVKTPSHLAQVKLD